jgi:hypothetical protein
MGNQYENIVNQALRAYAKCKDITLPEETLPEILSRRKRQAEVDKLKKNKKNKKKGGSEERGIPDKTPDKLHWSMSWRVALAVRETMMTDWNCIGPAFRLFQRLDRYNMNANYQYCKNVADDSVYCQYLKKDSEGNAISYRIARQQGTYTQFQKQGPISVFSPVCEETGKPANANHSTGILFCPEGYSISVDSATYGRKTKGFCRGDADSNTNICRGSKTVTITDLIAELCNGETACVIEASNDALNGGVDPCIGTEKLAEVYHTCYKNEY